MHEYKRCCLTIVMIFMVIGCSKKEEAKSLTQTNKTRYTISVLCKGTEKQNYLSTKEKTEKIVTKTYSFSEDQNNYSYIENGVEHKKGYDMNLSTTTQDSVSDFSMNEQWIRFGQQIVYYKDANKKERQNRLKRINRDIEINRISGTWNEYGNNFDYVNGSEEMSLSFQIYGECVKQEQKF
jgi:hypothetical protein